MYKVIREFKDTDGRVYIIDDVYPSPEAKKPNGARIKLLSTTNNKYGQIYLEKTAPEKG